MIEIHNCEQGTDEWQQLRAGKYTGSNAHKLLKYGAKPYSLTEASEFRGTFSTKRGHLLEDEAIEVFEAITHSTVGRPGFVTNSKFPQCGYSPDGLTDTHVIEVKCFNEVKHLKVAGGMIPLEVLAQIHFGMLLCEKKAAKLLLYHPKLDPEKAFRAIEVKAHRNIHSNFKRILTAAEVPA